jgi:glycosyltransferase involved in cell wall biosynthesis
MTSVIFFSYYFPPTGGAPAQRSLKFARYLPDFGYRPIVITGSGESRDEWTPEDQSLLGELPPGVCVERTRTRPPRDGSPLRRRAARWLGLQTDFSRWWTQSSIDLAESVLDRERARVIYATMSPFSTAEAAATIASRHGIPWVADLRDPWAIDEIQVHPTGLHKLIEQARMRKLLFTAAVVIMNTPEAADRLLCVFPEFRKKRVIALPNGFDPCDLPKIRLPKTTDFTIVHTGSFLTDVGLQHRRRQRLVEALRGATPGVDVATRSHLVLFEAIARWIQREPLVENSIRLLFSGHFPLGQVATTETDRRILERTTFLGYLPRNRNLEVVCSADLLFLAMHNLPFGYRSSTAPSKLYEYMASGRPILAAVPDGYAREVLTRVGTAALCRPDDAEHMSRLLSELYGRWKAKSSVPEPRPEVLAPFERRTLTRRLADEFDRVTGSRQPAC